MKQYIQTKNVLILILFILLAFSFLFNLLSYAPIKNKIPTFSKDNKKIIETKEVPKTISCTRITRLENKSQYDRALSLIYQRISEGIGTKYKYFPAELTYCIKIIEEEIDKSSDLEGYFILNNEDIQPNYYPIIVNSHYQEADDVVIALLLVHEINHVQQYMDIQNGKTPLTCEEKEIESFLAQRDFFPHLNIEEIKSLNSRYYIDESIVSSLHPQIKILYSMLGTHPESGCKGFFDFKCYEDHIYNELKQMITSDSYYKKQCNLK